MKPQLNPMQLDLVMSRFQPKVRTLSHPEISLLLRLTSLNNQNHSLGDMLIDRAVLAVKRREKSSSELGTSNANGDLVKLRIVSSRKSIFLSRVAAHTPIADILQFIA